MSIYTYKTSSEKARYIMLRNYVVSNTNMKYVDWKWKEGSGLLGSTLLHIESH